MYDSHIDLGSMSQEVSILGGAKDRLTIKLLPILHCSRIICQRHASLEEKNRISYESQHKSTIKQHQQTTAKVNMTSAKTSHEIATFFILFFLISSVVQDIFHQRNQFAFWEMCSFTFLQRLFTPQPTRCNKIIDETRRGWFTNDPMFSANIFI